MTKLRKLQLTRFFEHYFNQDIHFTPDKIIIFEGMNGGYARMLWNEEYVFVAMLNNELNPVYDASGYFESNTSAKKFIEMYLGGI